MIRRRTIIFAGAAFLAVGLIAIILWFGPEKVLDAVSSRFERPPPLTLARLNTPPVTDPECLSEMSELMSVSIRQSSDFVEDQKCHVAGAMYADQLASLPFSPKGPLMRCEVARALNNWLEEVVAPAATRHLNAEITTVGHLGTYNCRTIGRNSRVLSQHSFANAIDVAWFELADGRRIDLADGWSDDHTDYQMFWKQIHRLSCKYFHVSLGPDYDTAHADHFHFDMGPRRSCR